MEKEYDLYKKRYELYDSLFVQNNIDDILSIAENFLGNPIFILDTSYRLITRSHLAKCENSSIETHNGEDYLLSGIISLMKENKCMDTIYKTNNSFFHYSDENLIFCSIKVNGISIGYISVLQRNRDFEDEDLELTNILSNLLSIQIQKDNLFISNSGLDEEYYLMDLLVNDIDNLEYASERLKYSSFTLSKYNLILSIPFKQKYEDYRHNFGLRDLIQRLKGILGNCISTYYKDTIIFLISSDNEQIISEYIKENLLEFLKLNNLRCGASINFNNLLDIKDYFKQSICALKLSSYMKIHSDISYFEDYIEYYLIHISASSKENNDLPRIDITTLVNPLIKKLIKYDEKNKTELFTTLKTYLECNRNANYTSNKLNIHRSTLFYRFNKIQSLLDISLEDSNNLFKLELSIKILNYNKFS
ncbi:PucR family transcriptional regulator [Clostridium beijerinckii]|uniref:PucR family transcriptional regulator n=2 Tax=Clostridium TaxID=1485 RepID=A0A1S9N4E5_CLOBE|nr:helix-turn-helix domain-containing protein [Clostridium beijerinckii]MZK52220.1 PucR family transcriptional regulator [Clostridium beijerinckii]MZK60268.1 PucR family transcriptional regulator [Clostridium beijerinckii]MZK70600.1 PucR family transcriptional regulator [Clostridium beijerinckii]MZK75856.1 PucR family transcriptional regulator [Clostridium beijerinckii]MZK85592.1 PucR family transcriptional regulator [Clostridium beijerinckii]